MTPTSPAAEPAPSSVERSHFTENLRVATYGIVIFVLAVHLLEKFRDILQPLFVALFIGFLMQPIHRWFVRRGIPSLLSYGIILVLVMLGFFGVGWLMFTNFAEAANKEKLTQYENRFENMVLGSAKRLPFETKLEKGFLRKIELISPEDLAAAATATLGRFRDSTTWALTVLVFLLFFVAEKVSIP